MHRSRALVVLVLVACSLLSPAADARETGRLQLVVRRASDGAPVPAVVQIRTLKTEPVRRIFAAGGRLQLDDAPVGTFEMEARSQKGGLVGTSHVEIARGSLTRAAIDVRPAPKYRPVKQARRPPQGAELLQAAEVAYVAGRHQRASRLCKQVLGLVPGQFKAIQILGASSCYLKRRGDAQWAYDRVTATYRPLLEKLCLNNGVKLQKAGQR